MKLCSEDVNKSKIQTDVGSNKQFFDSIHFVPQHNFALYLLTRALHEKEQRVKGSLTRNQFFLVAFICSFAYYIFPGYLFQMLTSLSWVCWVFPHSVFAQQLGSGLQGLGIGAIGLDWSTVCLLYTSPSPRDGLLSRMPSSA